MDDWQALHALARPGQQAVYQCMVPTAAQAYLPFEVFHLLLNSCVLLRQLSLSPIRLIQLALQLIYSGFRDGHFSKLDLQLFDLFLCC